MSFFALIGLACCAVSLAVALELAMGVRRMTQVKDLAAGPPTGGPRVSVIIPACNEADTIEPALQSVLAMDYADREIIVVNDRSVDATADVLARMARQHPELRVHHITALPAGWLGKNHAMQSGAAAATGDYLLFTDADIIMAPSTLSRAITHMLQNRLDHLAIFFANIGGSGLLNALFLDICGALLLLYKPWQAKDPKSKRFMGVGAFNLVKTTAYRKIGGHEKIAMHPIDDIALGRLIKSHGFRQDCLLGHGFVSVHWYHSVRECINGLMKNSFAVYHYRLSAVAAGCLLIFLTGVMPLWGMVLADQTARLFFAATIGIRLLSFVDGFRQSGITPQYAGWSLITPYLNMYIAIAAAAHTIKNRGIIWRGTHYPLEKLKKYVR